MRFELLLLQRLLELELRNGHDGFCASSIIVLRHGYGRAPSSATAPLVFTNPITVSSAMSNDAIQDELTSINSIFDEGTLSPIDEDARLFSLRLPSLTSVTIRIEFPADYPDAPPSILGTQSVGQDVPKGMGSRAVEIIRDVLAEVYRPGEACIYDLIEEVREALEKAEEQGDLHLSDHMDEQHVEEKEPQHLSPENADLGPEPPWIIAPPISEKKSVFLARVAPVSSPSQAKQCLAHLLTTDKKAARATHNMTAWRIRGPNDTSYQDCDDDGETAAGGRMLHLMQLMDVWDVMLVVTRWYGGVHLGPDRFRIINTAAREALVLGGFTKESKDGEPKKKGKK
ncbi:UPF0029-domain-containing protein [Dothidotthia symphoricarpi CBS 119687]|uniref:UPF0029-domain-containing protein n=1 Tax=Dothidotthia symphoricarpi CBS 119687 TaxID=1392245 RepID=A0A6A6A3A8_9PLEO|nr:UPF0029-domain-containing protein [Dothidotthia symphoricarpi CBS 119687]KAF2125594.1 UPF0029-domain-containing protein [Dothidotthia symphoricarpi CBS 119687]